MKATRGLFQKHPGGKWWIRYVANGKYHRESVGSYTAAVTLLQKRHGDAVSQRKMPDTIRKRVVLFRELVADGLAWSSENKRSWRDDKSLAALLLGWWGDRDAGAITVEEMESKLASEARSRNWRPSTFNHHRALLLMIYREGRAKVGGINPARDMKSRNPDNDLVRYLNQYEPAATDIPYLKSHTTEAARLRAVIEHDYPEHLPEYVLAISTGLRKSSMYSLTWEMVNWTNRMIDLPTSKTGKALHLPINGTALAALRTLHSPGATGPVFVSARTGRMLANSKHWFEKAVVSAGLTHNFTWHGLRHTFASNLRMAGAKIEDVGALLGHSPKSIQMTMRYAHIGPSHLAKVSSLLDLSHGTYVAPEAEIAAPGLVN